MIEHHQLILQGLEELSARLQTTNCWATFEANGNEHWLQCADGQINMDWPFSDGPEESLLQEYFGSLAPFEVVSWVADLFATISIAKTDIAMLALVVDRVFQGIYELGSDYKLSYRIEDG